jgi:hypothetical protein
MSLDLRNGRAPQSDAGGSAEATRLLLRCECGERIDAGDEDELLRAARRHFREFHPDLDAEMPAGAILAMAEQTPPTRYE